MLAIFVREKIGKGKLDFRFIYYLSALTFYSIVFTVILYGEHGVFSGCYCVLLFEILVRVG